jgi:hypothetical protein
MLTATLSTPVSPCTHTLRLRGSELVTATLIAQIGGSKPVTSEPLRRPARHMNFQSQPANDWRGTPRSSVRHPSQGITSFVGDIPRSKEAVL